MILSRLRLAQAKRRSTLARQIVRETAGVAADFLEASNASDRSER